MFIAGLQKLTLLDYPGKTACILFTRGCNFRCPYCHNASLVVRGKECVAIPKEEVLSFLKKRQGLLDGVVVTGGEPLLYEDLPDLLRPIKEMGYLIKLDTNGTRFSLLRSIVEEGLADRVAMDIKNSPRLYPETCGREVDLQEITRSKDYLLEGHVEYEFRTTAVKGLHTRDSLLEAAAWIRGAKEYYLQQYKDSGDLIAPQGLTPFTQEEMHQLAREMAKDVPSIRVRGV